MYNKNHLQDRERGDHSTVVPPDPIPNSAVKRRCANGTSA